MAAYALCRSCRTPLGEAHNKELGLCQEHISDREDWHRFDLLREDGHSTYAAKLMAGLADPPDPDDE